MFSLATKATKKLKFRKLEKINIIKSIVKSLHIIPSIIRLQEPTAGLYLPGERIATNHHA